MQLFLHKLSQPDSPSTVVALLSPDPFAAHHARPAPTALEHPTPAAMPTLPSRPDAAPRLTQSVAPSGPPPRYFRYGLKDFFAYVRKHFPEQIGFVAEEFASSISPRQQTTLVQVEPFSLGRREVRLSQLRSGRQQHTRRSGGGCKPDVPPRAHTTLQNPISRSLSWTRIVGPRVSSNMFFLLQS